MMFGFDFGAMLAQKYALLQQERNADTARAGAYGLSMAAGANLDNVKAGLLPNESQANIDELNARTAGQLETNKTIGPLAQSTIGLQRRQGQYYGANAGYLGTEAAGNNILNQQTAFEAYLERQRANQTLPGGGL